MDEHGGVIFRASTVAGPFGADGARPMEEVDANIRLAAAAKELLAALVMARRFIVNGVEFGFIRMPDMQEDTAHKTLPAIDAAIAAATGEAP
jgi:hypothetical protein